MPEALIRAAKAIARKRGYSKERTNAYAYGAARRTGWVPSTQRKKWNGKRKRAVWAAHG
jgi:hypothetical protein